MLKKLYRAGEKIEFDSISGEIDRIELTITRLKSGKGEIIIPNAELVRKIVKKGK